MSILILLIDMQTSCHNNDQNKDHNSENAHGQNRPQWSAFINRLIPSNVLVLIQRANSSLPSKLSTLTTDRCNVKRSRLWEPIFLRACSLHIIDSNAGLDGTLRIDALNLITLLRIGQSHIGARNHSRCGVEIQVVLQS